MSNPAATFVDYAETLGLDEGQFSVCLHSDRHAELVTANMELGNRLNVQRTPTIMVEQGGAARVVGPDFQTIKAYVDDILAEEPGAP